MKFLISLVFALIMVPAAQAQEQGQDRHYVAVAAKPEAMPNCEIVDCEDYLSGTIAIIKSRFGASLENIEYEGGGRLGLVVVAEDPVTNVRALLGIKDLAFMRVNEQVSPSELGEGELPEDTIILPVRNPEYEEFIALYRDGGINGDRVANAVTGVDSYSQEPVVNIKFDKEGGVQFAEFTVANVGKRLAIVLDGEVLNTPFINEPILGGQVQISGGFSQEEANDLAMAIGAGRLPVPFTIVE